MARLVLPNRPFSVVMRAGFAARLQATVGIDFWNKHLEPLFTVTLSRRWHRVNSIGDTDRYGLKLVTGYLIVFRVDYENDLIIPLGIHPPD